jgi:transcriptional regulator with XRE-family HTH domain
VTGQQIRELRKEKGWTQAQLARALGTDAVTVSRWEREISRPRPAGILRLKTLLGYDEGFASAVPFVEDPAIRLRKLDDALRQMRYLKRHAEPRH